MGPIPQHKLSDNLKLLKEIHTSLNKEINLKVDTVTAASPKKIWWQCDKYEDHVWFASIRSRAVNNIGCRVCSGHETLAGFNDLVTTHPELANQWHPTKNNLQAEEVTQQYSKLIWWICPKNHEYQMNVNDRAKRRRNCSLCRGLKVVAGVNDFATTHPELASQLHPTKNSDFDPTKIVGGNDTKVWWLGECGHEWEMTVEKRTSRGQNCSVCAGKKVADDTNLTATHPDIASEWHPTKNNSLKPEHISAGSHTKVWWLGECGHEWDAVLKSRAISGHNCPVCAGKRVQVDYNSLSAKFPSLAKEWHPTKNKNLLPEHVVFGSRKHVWWQCGKGHEWQATCENRTRAGSGCPQCYSTTFVSKPELEIGDWLKGLGLNVQTTVYKITKRGEIDIYLPDQRIAIEYNGLYWHSEATGKGKKYHYDKWKACKDKGIQLIQIWEDDYLSNPELVKRMLAYKLGVTTKRKVFARKTVVRSLTQLQSNKFLSDYHIQGAVDGGIRVGLFETNGDIENLVAVMVLKREPGTEGRTLNLLRYATVTNVIGGFTKLLKYVEKELTPESIISFSDNTVSDGGLYENNGFVAVKELKPDYMYVVKGKRVHKFNYRLKRFREDPTLQYKEGLSERELAALNKISRIWDAGKIKWKTSDSNE